MTPKQMDALVVKVMSRKAVALRMVAKHIGMLPLNPEVAKRNREKMSDELILWSLITLVSDAPSWKRGLAMLALDLISMDWREIAGPEIMGGNVSRDSPEVAKWRRAVLARDNHRCTACGSAEKLHAHHIIRWADDPSQRLNVLNGTTLCEPCHINEHQTYG